MLSQQQQYTESSMQRQDPKCAALLRLPPEPRTMAAGLGSMASDCILKARSSRVSAVAAAASRARCSRLAAHEGGSRRRYSCMGVWGSIAYIVLSAVEKVETSGRSDRTSLKKVCIRRRASVQALRFHLHSGHDRHAQWMITALRRQHGRMDPEA